MTDRNKIPISHPELGEARVVASALPVWLERGWTAVEDPSPAEVSLARQSNYADVGPSDETASRDLRETKNVAAKAGS